MNPSTGEIREFPANETPPAGWVELRVGSVVEIYGVKCRLTYVNAGKRRLTFVPVDAKMPGAGG